MMCKLMLFAGAAIASLACQSGNADRDWVRTRNGVLFKGVEIHNVAELVPTNGLYRFSRVDARARASMEGRTRPRAFCSTGVELRFCLRSPEARIVMGGLGPSVHETCQVYRGDFAVDWPDATRTVVGERTEWVFRKTPDEHLRRRVEKFGCRYDPDVIRVILPQSADLGIRDVIGDVIPPPPEKLPARTYLAYGSSITHGSCAGQILRCYASLVGEALAVDVRNVGLAGSAFMQPEMADFIAGESFDLCSLEMGVNTLGRMSSDEYERRVRYMVRRVAESHPGARILAIDVFRTELSAEALERAKGCRRILERVVRELALPNVTYVNGLDALPERGALTTGPLHPSPQGHAAIAAHLVPLFRTGK